MLLFCFLLPLLGAVRITLLGELSLAEPVIILYALFSFSKFVRFYQIPLVRRVIVLGFFWLVSLILSDLYRNTPSEDYLRGWSKIGILLLSYFSCLSLIGYDLRRAGALFAGNILMPLLNYILYAPDYPFYKFVFGFVVSAGAFGLAMALKGERRTIFLILPFAAGVIALMYDCRSLAGITFCAVFYYFILTNKLFITENILRTRFIIILMLGLFSFGVIATYSILASRGLLYNDGIGKYESQLNEKGEFSILTGRSELYFTLPKIIKSPILGLGSWPKDLFYVAERAEVLGLNPQEVINGTGGLIPAHSHLFGSWLEAGFMGAVFWLYVLYLVLCILMDFMLIKFIRWSGLLSLVLYILVWDILFSPFGGERRFSNGLYLAIVTIIILLNKK